MLLDLSDAVQHAAHNALNALRSSAALSNVATIQRAIAVLDCIYHLEDQTPRITTLANNLVTANATIAERDARIHKLQNQPTPMDITPEVEDLRAQLAEANDTIAAQETALTSTCQQLNDSRTMALALAKRRQANNSTPTMKISDPEKFTGNRAKLQPFLAQLRLKASTFPTEQARLCYAVSVLDKEALDQVLPFVQNDRVDLENLAALIEILEAAFGNPNRVADPEHKLNTIHQSSRDFSSYFAEFQRYASEVTWNDSAKLGSLRRRLSYRLKQDLIMVTEEHRTVAALVSICQGMENRRRMLQQESGSRPVSTPQPRSTYVPRAPAPAVTVAISPASSTSTGTHPGPMDLSSNHRRVLREEIAHRVSEGLCRYCGGSGHFADRCLNKTPRTPLCASETSV